MLTRAFVPRTLPQAHSKLATASAAWYSRCAPWPNESVPWGFEPIALRLWFSISFIPRPLFHTGSPPGPPHGAPLSFSSTGRTGGRRPHDPLEPEYDPCGLPPLQWRTKAFLTDCQPTNPTQSSRDFPAFPCPQACVPSEWMQEIIARQGMSKRWPSRHESCHVSNGASFSALNLEARMCSGNEEPLVLWLRCPPQRLLYATLCCR